MKRLRIDALCKAFGRLVVTDAVTLTIEAGERHAIIGPNGAGKTSLINQLGGQLRPDSGRIHLGEDDITGWSPERISRAGVARTFQRNNLFFGLSVAENVRLAQEIVRGNPYNFFSSVASRTVVLGETAKTLQSSGLDGHAAARVAHLSYGNQRQLEVAIALSSKPSVLLLDEPTSGMSALETESMIKLISAIPRTMTIIMIEHDMKVVFSIADRVTVLFHGKVLASGPPAEIRANPRVREIYLGGLDEAAA